MHWRVAWTRAALGPVVAGAMALAVVSGGSSADPRTPAGLPGEAPPFLGTAVAGSGGLTAAVDAYGDVVDLRAPGPAGRALIDNPADRQATGTVAADTGIVPRVRISGEELPLWRADRVWQRYRPGTNVVSTEARFGAARVEIVYAAAGGRLACATRSSGPRISVGIEEPAGTKLRCDTRAARRAIRSAARSDRRWLSRARPLGAAAPAWAGRMYQRSLLTLRALTDRRTGAVAAGARDGWAYVWPRDAGTAALALAAAGYRPEARRVVRFLLGLDLAAAARFDGSGAPVPGREAQGDASGWVAVATRTAGLTATVGSSAWRDRPDYQEGDPGDYLANAIASTAAAGSKNRPGVRPSASRRIAVPGAAPMLRRPGGDGIVADVGIGRAFGAAGGLLRRAGDPESGLDSAAAWAVRPFPQPALFPAVRRTLLRLADERTTSTATQSASTSIPSSIRFGITPTEAWPGAAPWTAPTAWTAWSLAALSNRALRTGHSAAARRDRRTALSLLGDLRRAATPTGALPERVDARTGVPASTTPLAWSHAFAILALRELWPGSRGRV